MLPDALTDRQQCLAGSLLCLVALAVLLAVPLTTGWLVPLLALLGPGPGVFTPANNPVIMKVITARTAGTGGGLVNMARALGIAIGVALVGLEPQRWGGRAAFGRARSAGRSRCGNADRSRGDQRVRPRPATIDIRRGLDLPAETSGFAVGQCVGDVR